MQKVPNNIWESVFEWFKKHHHFIHSPFAKDTIQVKNPETGERERNQNFYYSAV